MRALILPTLKEYARLLEEVIEGDGTGKVDAEMVVGVVLSALETLEDERGGMNGIQDGYGDGDEGRKRLSERIGGFLTERVVAMGRPGLVRAILDS